MTPSTLLSPGERSDIQGLVASGYGHLPWAAYLFFRVQDPELGRAWLRERRREVTTAAPWPRDPEGNRIKPQEAVNLALSAPGLRALEVPASVVCTFSPEFQEGMAHPDRAEKLGDDGESHPSRWELGGPATPPIHGALILHAATEAGVGALVQRQLEVMERNGEGVVLVPDGVQEGTIWSGHAEPFGFRDGIAQPRVEGFHGDGVPTGEFVLGYPNHYGILPPGPLVPHGLDPDRVLPPSENPHHPARHFRDLGRHGSYLVYRKLAQDVAGFWRFMVREADRRGGGRGPSPALRIASLCVGRWPGGAPLELAPHADDPSLADADDFGYAEDPEGLRCPLGAHVRRTHPRDLIHPYGPEASLRMSRAHRLLRRGRIYGRPLFDPGRLLDPSHEVGRLLRELEDDEEPRGLHFLSVEAGIASQFEFVQQAWCNNPRFNGLRDNPDPLIGRMPGPTDPPGTPPAPGQTGHAPGVMTFPRGPIQDRTAPLPRFVTNRGGAYLFLPGLRALRWLSGAVQKAAG
ncbi:MAG: peroxidase [Gemmatimonadales bacterium]|nr:MAG: peroxidase [Gemmatimonadales bacterium]